MRGRWVTIGPPRLRYPAPWWRRRPAQAFTWQRSNLVRKPWPWVMAPAARIPPRLQPKTGTGSGSHTSPLVNMPRTEIFSKFRSWKNKSPPVMGPRAKILRGKIFSAVTASMGDFWPCMGQLSYPRAYPDRGLLAPRIAVSPLSITLVDWVGGGFLVGRGMDDLA
jgi:hypothetical protein